MTTARHRKGKNFHKREDNHFLDDALEPELRSGNQYILMFILLLLLVVGGTTFAWFSHAQQQTISHLTESLSGLQMKIVKFQQSQEEMKTTVEPSIPEGFAERLEALEGAYAQAQKQVDLAVSTAEQLKAFDLRSQVASMRTDMMVRLSDLELTQASAEELERVLKSKSEEFQAVRENLSDVASANKALAGNVAGLSASFASTESKVLQQAALVDTLTTQLETQVSELLSLKEMLSLHQAQLETSSLDIANLKGLLEVEQAKRTQILGEQLNFVRRSLEDQSQESLSLHSSLRTQLESIQSQLEIALHPTVPEDPEQAESGALEQELQQEVLQQVQEEEVEQEVQGELLAQEAQAPEDQEVQEKKVEPEVQTEPGIQEEEVEQGSPLR
ncbi:hypothetical protein GJAV_G00171610 [Gymnothorax javanicus]|nr:hypothetical protein GJAV_G00171610 [Gymnothorax javanicus]